MMSALEQVPEMELATLVKNVRAKLEWHQELVLPVMAFVAFVIHFKHFKKKSYPIRYL